MSNLRERIKNLSSRQQELLAVRLGMQNGFAKKEKNGSGRQRLVAYVTGDSALEKSKLRSYAKARLPEYMMPSAVVELETMPRLPNGKIDRSALPEQEEKMAVAETGFAAAGSEIEQRLTAIWEEVLAFSPIGVSDNFFEIGGDSILSIQIVAKVRAAGLSMAPDHIFKYQNIAELAAVLDTDAAEKTAVPKIVLSKKAKPLHIPEQLSFSENGRENVEAVYPLSPMQEALLFHNLYAKSTQLGFVQVSCKLEGGLDKKAFAEAWQKVVDNHPVLRTSIHWEGLEKPLQVVHRKVGIPLGFEDWTSKSLQQFEASLEGELQADGQLGYDFTKAPIMRVKLFRADDDLYYFTWSGHHILLDGWSWSLLFKEVFQQYQALKKGAAVDVATRPYSDFIDWTNGQNLASAERFWRKSLAGAVGPVYFQKNNFRPVGQMSKGQPVYKTRSFVFSEKKTAALKSLAQQQRLTLSTLVQGAWALLLHSVSGKKDILFGKTLSGRSIDLPGIESMMGLFTNTLPVRFWIFEDMKLGDWLAYIFEEQASAQPFEQTPLHQVQAWSGMDGADGLFDSLLVFQNYKVGDFEAYWEGGLDVKITANGTATNYPITLIVMPGEELACHLVYDKNKFPPAFAEQISTHFAEVLDRILAQPESNVGQLCEQLRLQGFTENISQNGLSEKTDAIAKEASFIAPRNETELSLVRIWESIFKKNQVSVKDNFFEIGGRSLLAVQLFARIDKDLGHNLPPITLLQHPTIEALARLIQKEEKQSVWSSLVPMRASGSKTPLFCIHAGGGHVFFYSGLVQHLDAEQPVYALEPVGLEDGKPEHSTTEEMAVHYIREIRSVQPDGPYALLSTCYGNSISLEMAVQLKAIGQEVSLLAMIDSGPPDLVEIPGLATQKRLERFLKLSRKELWDALREKWRHAVAPIKHNFESRQATNLRLMQDRLVDIYQKYDWKKYDGKVTLIRSSEKAEQPNPELEIELWSRLALKGVDEYVVEGHHLSIFKEPEAHGLARQVQACLDGAGG